MSSSDEKTKLNKTATQTQKHCLSFFSCCFFGINDITGIVDKIF